jgi:hypothetical protein
MERKEIAKGSAVWQAPTLLALLPPRPAARVLVPEVRLEPPRPPVPAPISDGEPRRAARQAGESARTGEQSSAGPARGLLTV